MIEQVGKTKGGENKNYRPIRFTLFNRPSAVATMSSVITGLTVLGTLLKGVTDLLLSVVHTPMVM